MTRKKIITQIILFTLLFPFISYGQDTQLNSNSLKDVFSPVSSLSAEEKVVILLSSFVFTFILGLIIPVILRFVIIRRPIKKWISLVVVFIIFFLQWFLSIIATNGQAKMLPLIIVAYISYQILHRGFGNNEEESVKYCKECGNKIHSAATICNKCGKETVIKN